MSLKIGDKVRYKIDDTHSLLFEVVMLFEDNYGCLIKDKNGIERWERQEFLEVIDDDNPA